MANIIITVRLSPSRTISMKHLFLFFMLESLINHTRWLPAINLSFFAVCCRAQTQKFVLTEAMISLTLTLHCCSNWDWNGTSGCSGRPRLRSATNHQSTPHFPPRHKNAKQRSPKFKSPDKCSRLAISLSINIRITIIIVSVSCLRVHIKSKSQKNKNLRSRM